MNLPETVREKLRALPDKPGCYLMRDRRGRIIYVGRAVSLRKRVQSYFRPSTIRRADPKLRSLVHSVHDLDILPARNEAEAVLTEGRLIKEYRPRYNVSFRDDKRFLMIRADARLKFPAFEPCRIRREDGCLYFGPYTASSAARAALDFAERTFGIRKCSPLIPDASTYKHCHDDIIRTCAAPCVGKVTETEYHRRFDEACAFLRGERPAFLKGLKDAMAEASAARDFEKAAAIRDTWLLLKRAIRERGRGGVTPEMKRRDGVAGVAALKDVLGLEKAPRVIEAFDISNIVGTYAVAAMVCSADGAARRNRYRRFRIKTVEGADDPAMMAEVVGRRYRRLLEEKAGLPDLVLVDGGPAQLQAARGALDRLGLQALPTAGLAKQQEEIYAQGRAAPIRLPASSPALKVLQRLRDEAHRFALAYHQRLRNRAIRESALDEIPGIGEKKKRALLTAFGSVRDLAGVPEEQIASVAGIGYELAKAIKARLAGP